MNWILLIRIFAWSASAWWTASALLMVAWWFTAPFSEKLFVDGNKWTILIVRRVIWTLAALATIYCTYP